MYNLIDASESATCNVHLTHGHIELLDGKDTVCDIGAIGATNSHKKVDQWTCLDCLMWSFPGFGSSDRTMDWITKQMQSADKIKVRLMRVQDSQSRPPYADPSLE